MPTIQHNVLPNADLHEPKGVSAAAEGKVYMADGAGSGTWHYLAVGWDYSKDNASAQTFSTTPALLSINGSGSTTQSGYNPFEIRGTSNLWNTTSDRIMPINAGDSYDVRLDLPVTAESASPTELTVELDIQSGGTYGGATVIVNRYALTGRSTPYTVSIAFPIFALATFVANGGQFWLTTDTGTIDITAPAIYVGMNTNGDM